MLRIALIVIAAVILIMVIFAIVGMLFRLALIAAVFLAAGAAIGWFRRGRRSSRRQDRWS